MHRSARLHIAHIVHGATHKNRADVFHFCFVYSTRSQWAHSTTLKNAMCLIFHSIDRARLCMFYLILFIISNFCLVAKDEDQAHNVTQKTQLEDEEKKKNHKMLFLMLCSRRWVRTSFCKFCSPCNQLRTATRVKHSLGPNGTCARSRKFSRSESVDSVKPTQIYIWIYSDNR